MAKQFDMEDQGDSWSEYEKVLNGGNDATGPEEGEENSPSQSPVDKSVTREGVGRPSRKSRKKTESGRPEASAERNGVRLTAMFPDTVVQQVKLVALVQKRSISEVVREAVSRYVESVFADCMKSLPVSK